MFLTGAAKHIANFDELFRTQLNIPVETADMTKNIRIRENINAWQNEEQKFVSACPVLGMCLKHKELDIDLTSSELRIQRQMEEKRKHITVMGVLFASVAMMTSLLLLTNFHNKNSYLTELKQKITGMEKEANEVENMRMCIDLVEDRLDARKRSLNTLHEIFNLTPREIYYTNINIDEKKRAILQGHAVAMSDVFEFVTTLEKSSYFENVKTTYTTTKKDKDGEYAKFEIICVYQK